MRTSLATIRPFTRRTLHGTKELQERNDDEQHAAMPEM